MQPSAGNYDTEVQLLVSELSAEFPAEIVSVLAGAVAGAINQYEFQTSLVILEEKYLPSKNAVDVADQPWKQQPDTPDSQQQVQGILLRLQQRQFANYVKNIDSLSVLMQTEPVLKLPDSNSLLLDAVLF